MADEAKLGTTWSDDEVDAIVADYFSMLAAELSRKRYTKSQHSAALMARIGRTHRSVEFKHQNISAVLEEMGMPWIAGYKPKRNYQNAIFGAIERYLSNHPSALAPLPSQAIPRQPSLPSDVFVPPPVLKPAKDRVPEQLRQLVQRFDPVERDRRNRSLGRAGESFVFELEKRRLVESDRKDLAKEVRWIADEDGDGAGYDILSFDAKGQSRLIEVKTTNGSARTPFFITRNEFRLAKERAVEWRIYRVHRFSAEPRIFTISPPLEDALKLSTQTWRASF
jgi:Domain of unknown function (DUF3883)